MAAEDTLDQAELQADLGTAWGVGLILSNPQLAVLAYKSQGWSGAYYDKKKKRVIPGQKRKGKEWSAAKIALEIQNTKWYQNRDGSTRMAENARLSDPATWARNLSDISDTLQRQAAQMGADISGLNLEKTAERILKENYLYVDRNPDGAIPESVINSFLVPLINAGEEGQFAGGAATNAMSIRATAKSYGVDMTDKWVLDTVRKLQDGSLTQADVLNQIVTSARSAYPTLGENINESVSVQDLASSYISKMASVWEMDEDTIDLKDPTIQKAMMYIDPGTGQTRQKSLWEFEQELRQDKRWDSTAQGQQELSEAGMSMLRDFGFWK